MKNFKNGFSLAELLIALAIISIIAIMGYSITKKNTEKAYNLYIYTGYSAIQSAIADANSRGYKPIVCINKMNPTLWTNEDDKCDFTEHIKNLLKAEDIATAEDGSGIRTLKTPNNIVYKLDKTPCLWGGNGTYCDNSIHIYMQTPSVRHKKTNGDIVNHINAWFTYEDSEPVLKVNAKENWNNFQDIDLRNRVDLLPFYIDTGTNGKILTNCNEYTYEIEPDPSKYEKLQFYSYREAWCKVYGTSSSLDCTGINDTGNYADIAVIKVANPRKVF